VVKLIRLSTNKYTVIWHLYVSIKW